MDLIKCAVGQIENDVRKTSLLSRILLRALRSILWHHICSSHTALPFTVFLTWCVKIWKRSTQKEANPTSASKVKDGKRFTFAKVLEDIWKSAHEWENIDVWGRGSGDNLKISGSRDIRWRKNFQHRDFFYQNISTTTTSNEINFILINFSLVFASAVFYPMVFFQLILIKAMESWWK